MTHVEKYTRGATGNMLAHYDRTKISSTSLIDPDCTPLNYNLAATDQPLTQLDFIHKRLSEIKVLNRKDVNVFCDWIVTAPQKLSENEYADFFRETYKFLNERYVKENVISAYVHMDESRPHIHYAFVPVAIDKKKNIPKLSAKEVITLKELKIFHKDLSNRLNNFFGRDIGILNGATDLGNKTIKQLKKTGENLQNYADAEIQTTTNIITKAMGKGKVLVSESDIKATQQAAATTAALVDDINAANDSIKKIREKPTVTLQNPRSVSKKCRSAKPPSSNESRRP
ncbi:MAG: plasmid recombination protein [Lachnospiraceae bacterium]|nr:plasmid recombination protein [Lachnospiraceae bacterium]